MLPPLLLVAAATTFAWVGAGAPLPAANAPLWPSLRRVFADLAFRRLLAVLSPTALPLPLPATLFLFFVADVLQAESASGWLLALYFVAGRLRCRCGCVSAACGRSMAWLAAMLLAMLAFAGASLLGPGDVPPLP